MLAPKMIPRPLSLRRSLPGQTLAIASRLVLFVWLVAALLPSPQKYNNVGVLAFLPHLHPRGRIDNGFRRCGGSGQSQKLHPITRARGSVSVYDDANANATNPIPTRISLGDRNSKDDDGRSDEMIASISEYFAGSTSEQEGNNKKRGNIQLVAGSGKTYIAWKVMESLFQPMENSSANGKEDKNSRNSKIGVYVTPYLTLVDQALSNREEHGIMTGGQRTVETMIVASQTSRKQERCSTDVDDIMDFLSNPSDTAALSKILVCTYNSLPKIGTAIERMNHVESASNVQDGNTTVIDFAVFDEAHRMEGLTRSNKGSGFSYGLYDSNLEIHNRLFMTGTPHNYTQKAKVVKFLPTNPKLDGSIRFIPENEEYGLQNYNGEVGEPCSRTTAKIKSISDESLFGPCLAQKTHLESVEQNITLPISLLVVETDVFGEHDEQSKMDKNGDSDISQKDHYLPLSIKSAFHKYPIKQAVSFHSTTQRARDFLDQARNVLGSDSNGDENNVVALFNIDHTMPSTQREEILQEARESPKSLITNCKLLSMGVDNPSWDLAVIADPVRSSVYGRQMIGRVGRKAPGKERGYVLVPMPISEEKMDMEHPAFEIFVNVFQHMVSLDPSLQQDVVFVIEKNKEMKQPMLPEEYPDRLQEAFDFPTTMPLELQNYLMDRAIVEYTNEMNSESYWNQMFEKLTVYQQREGHCKVQTDHEEDGAKLGGWVVRQRLEKKKGTLDKDREERLNSIGFVWDVASQAWEDSYSLLLQYKEREGHCKVPKDYEEDGVNLGRWVVRQRTEKKKGTLDKDREERLNSIGFVWDAASQAWEDSYLLLLQYKEREGHCKVPQDYEEDGVTLGRWVFRQRTEKKKGTLDKDREERLNSIGFVWDLDSHTWEDIYLLLLQYKEREGHCKVPFDHNKEGVTLGRWVTRQRQEKKKGTLDKDREDRLNSIGFVWDVASQAWEDSYSLLLQYKEREGHHKVPKDYEEDGVNLGRWVDRQRNEKKKGTLDNDREERLNSIGFVWDVSSQFWEDSYSLLLQYKEREGHCKVPFDHEEDGVTLGNWVTRQRTEKKKGTLDKDREDRLNSIGFVWDAASQAWEDAYSLLLQYKERERHCKVPRDYEEDGVTLGRWVVRQRTEKKKGTLDKDREERLNSIGFVWHLISQAWEDTYSLLLQYKEREGHCKVLVDHEEDGVNLGKWVGTQRQEKKKGTLDKDREERLNSIGFVWDLDSQFWEDRYLLLLQYKEREGHCKVPFGHEEAGAKLGAWVFRQRTEKKKGTLDKDREERLNSIGFVWNLDVWEDSYSLLLQYKEREGHCKVPVDHEEDGAKLGAWGVRQRLEKKKGTLDKDREERLNSIGFLWDLVSQFWEDSYSLLLQYKEREGHCKVPVDHEEDGAKLGAWVFRQRTEKKKGTLDKDREERLNSIGFVWGLDSHTWEDIYLLLLQYKEREGHCKVPFGHNKEGVNLGRWVAKQRQVKKKGKIDKDREERLNSIGFVWDAASQAWEDSYSLLLQYKEREGHCKVPVDHEEDGAKLGAWVAKQRLEKKKGKIDKDREERLNSIGFVWDMTSQAWEDSYSLLLQYKEREGHCKVPVDHEEDGVTLGRWVTRQRRVKKKGTLDKDREERLSSIGFVWNFHKI